MLKKKLRGKSKFLRKMNELMEIYSRNQDTAFDAMCESLRFKLLEVR